MIYQRDASAYCGGPGADRVIDQHVMLRDRAGRRRRRSSHRKQFDARKSIRCRKAAGRADRADHGLRYRAGLQDICGPNPTGTAGMSGGAD